MAAAGPDLEEAKKRARNFFFHWFPLVVVSGGGCGTDADAPPTLAASSKLHTLAVSGRTSNISLSRGKTSSRRWKMAQNSFFFLKKKYYILGNCEGSQDPQIINNQYF